MTITIEQLEKAAKVAKIEKSIIQYAPYPQQIWSRREGRYVSSHIAALEAKVRELEAERDAHHSNYKFMQRCAEENNAKLTASRQQVERLVEALITIDQKLEAAVLCEAKTGKLMPASPLRIDVYKAFAAIDQECNG